MMRRTSYSKGSADGSEAVPGSKEVVSRRRRSSISKEGVALAGSKRTERRSKEGTLGNRGSFLDVTTRRRNSKSIEAEEAIDPFALQPGETAAMRRRRLGWAQWQKPFEVAGEPAAGA